MEINLNKTIAVVGASNNEEKYGYKIVHVLKAKGIKVFPVNPKAECVQGLKPYASLKDLPERPDVINFVVPPEVTLQVLDEVKELGFDNVWFQPGSFDEKVIEKARSYGLNYEDDSCLLVVGRGL